MAYNAYNPGAVGLVQTVAVDVGFADDGTPVVVPGIKPGDLLLRQWFDVDELFNDSGTDLIEAGWGADPNGHVAAEDVSSVTLVAGTVSLVVLPAGETYQVLYTGQNGNSTTGHAKVIVEFVPQGE